MSNPGQPDGNPYEPPRARHEKPTTRRWNLGTALRGLLAFILAAVFGDAVWRLSPPLLGTREPWDASLSLYFLLMFLGGFACSLICPRRFGIPLAGLYLGQVAYCLWQMDLSGTSIYLPVISVAVLGSPPALFGAILVYGLSWVRWR